MKMNALRQIDQMIKATFGIIAVVERGDVLFSKTNVTTPETPTIKFHAKINSQ